MSISVSLLFRGHAQSVAPHSRPRDEADEEEEEEEEDEHEHEAGARWERTMGAHDGSICINIIFVGMCFGQCIHFTCYTIRKLVNHFSFSFSRPAPPLSSPPAYMYTLVVVSCQARPGLCITRLPRL